MKTILKNASKNWILFLLLWLPVALLAQTETKVNKAHYNLDKYDVALEGYDIICYFLGTPCKGNSNIYYFYKGVRYEFISQKNLQQFKSNPENYAVAYGGWCAYAMGATGDKVSVDPLTYKIINGKLYLYYHSIINNTLSKWNADEKNLKISADKNWNLTLLKK